MKTAVIIITFLTLIPIVFVLWKQRTMLVNYDNGKKKLKVAIHIGTWSLFAQYFISAAYWFDFLDLLLVAMISRGCGLVGVSCLVYIFYYFHPKEK